MFVVQIDFKLPLFLGVSRNGGRRHYCQEHRAKKNSPLASGVTVLSFCLAFSFVITLSV